MLFLDFHIHSKYARGTSKNTGLLELGQGAKTKGLNVIGTGDFFHPIWQKELKDNLQEVDNTGLFSLKQAVNPRNENQTLFMLQNEIATVHSSEGKGRRVHHVITCKTFDELAQLTDAFSKKGRMDYDGRLIFGMSCAEAVELCKGVSMDCHVIPAHAWTPWFGVFGSKSGFDSLQEAYEDQAKHIFAIETGLSSDPAMNWMLSKLDSISLVSNSDCHSHKAHRIGRECNAFSFSKEEAAYEKLFHAVKNKTKDFLYTIEVDPNYGIYHFDGHRECSFFCSPEESKKLGNTCPICKKPLTIGVLNRVQELADRPLGFKPKNAVDFKKLLPLQEVIALAIGCPVESVKAQREWQKLIAKFGSELNVLLNVSEEELSGFAPDKIAKLIIENRFGRIKVVPGYDGAYGKPVI